ncbi:hypothetical protein BBO99_00007842 [Phytophthora kernoviae]|uniref:Necrosis inducing-like protein NPP1 type n=1 Tax=Phytophthora kernoviae TaxID=325452 RepID=A0A3R7NC05_9STRA|nr:hypothetical protein JM16_007654 [Phytophthora kernoviae]RLN38024.1 hypothetical protein BBI17_007883 [Phytophthora kernoviae]RLN76071.1 hypothetical protein BBO99_00007842 [Phytophthora kernoviae]
MKLGALFVTVAVLLATIDAEWVETWIGHDEITPWYQEVPDLISEKAAVRFKPRLRIASGGNGAGAQVYGRSRWHYDRWAIMYSWYFPKDSPSPGLGHRHDWEHAIVWIDNPDVENPKIIGAATSSHNGYEKYSSVPASCLEGDALKVEYFCDWPMNHEMQLTDTVGGFQDLVMWDQMTDEARQALNTVSFGKANCPFNDGNFGGKLDKAWPY